MQMTDAIAQILPDGKRLHLQAGPIDLIIDADGNSAQVAQAFAQARVAFEPVLADLVTELVCLRTPLSDVVVPAGPVAKIMTDAAARFTAHNVTPMIAVAGAVADHILAAMLKGRDLDRVYVNNGGDIAFWLGDGQSFEIGIVSRVDAPEISLQARVCDTDNVQGIATSGWRGRSFSLGVADAVTVLAPTAALADAAATLIANEVDPGPCPQVTRCPANDLDPDSDLADRLIVTDVQSLSEHQIDVALSKAEKLVGQFIDAGHMIAASLSLQGHVRTMGNLANPFIETQISSETKSIVETQYAVG